MIARRQKIAEAFLVAVNPLVDFALDETGTLLFDNAAVRAGVAPAPIGGYTGAWFTFDNDSGTTRPIGQPNVEP